MGRLKKILIRTVGLIIGIIFSIHASGQDNYHVDSLKQTAYTAQTDTDRAEQLSKLGGVYMDNSMLDSAEHTLTEAMNIFYDIGNNKRSADCLVALGTIHCYKSTFDLAIDNYLRALDIYIDVDHKSGIARCYNNLGNVYYDLGAFDDAIQYYFQSLDISEEVNDKQEIFGTLNNIGILYQTQKLWDEAAEYFLRSLEIAEEIGNNAGVAIVYNNIGLVKLNQGKNCTDTLRKNLLYEETIYYCLKSFDISSTLNNKLHMSSSLNNLGVVYENRGSLQISMAVKINDYYKARDYYTQALDINLELGDKAGISNSYESLASLNLRFADLFNRYSAENNTYLEKAIDYALKSYVLADEIHAIPRKSRAAFTLMKAYREFGKPDLALEYADIHIATKDSLFEEDKIKTIHELATKYETEKQLQEIELLNVENQKNQQKIRSRNLMLLSLGLLLTIIIGIAYSIRQKSRQRLDQMQNELQKYILLENNPANRSTPSSEHFSDKYGLTERESEILAHLSEGASYASIAENIFVSKNTVKFHIKNIYLKLDVKNKIEALNKISV